MTPAIKGFWLTIAGCAGAACFLVAYKLAAGLGDTTDATLVMLLSAAALNTAGTGNFPRRRFSRELPPRHHTRLHALNAALSRAWSDRGSGEPDWMQQAGAGPRDNTSD